MTRTYKQSSTGWEEYDYMRNIVEEKGFKFKEGVAEQLSPVPLRDGKPQQPRLMVVADPDGVRIFREYLRVDDQDDDGHTPLIGFVGYLEGQCPEMRRNVFNGGSNPIPGCLRNVMGGTVLCTSTAMGAISGTRLKSCK